MFHLIIATTIVALNAAAQLPSATYLPGVASGLNSGVSGILGAAGSFNGNQLNDNNRREDNGHTRAQQAVERNAAILRLNKEADENGFQYAYETSNGIQAQESGNAVQTQGGFSYTGDDGQVYTVTFTAGENGFRPEGAHLPVPPPTPVEILQALKQNEKDEAAGIFDDGLYHPDNNGNGINAGQTGQGFGSNYNSNSG